jgi:hypothetical protein
MDITNNIDVIMNVVNQSVDIDSKQTILKLQNNKGRRHKEKTLVPIKLQTHENYSPFKYKKNCCKTESYDAITNCKSAGIIPYTIIDGEVHFLFQKLDNPEKKKYSGYNDFGGKQSDKLETTPEIAAREFSEETCCIFYLAEQQFNNNYNTINNNNNNNYNYSYNYNNHYNYNYGYNNNSGSNVNGNSNNRVLAKYNLINLYQNIINYNKYRNKIDVNLLQNTINKSKTYFCKKIEQYVKPIHASSKEIYISYFVKVKYVNEKIIPIYEDLHIKSDIKYKRSCKWLSIKDIKNMDDTDFHKRLQITRIKKRILNYYDKNLFV